MPITVLIPTSSPRTLLADYPHEVEHMEDVEQGKLLTLYTGCVLAKYERNYYDDSDFYAIVFDRRTNTCRSMLVGTTRGGCGTRCSIDATDEIKALAREWLYDWHVRYMTAATERDARKIEPGKCVRFIKAYRPRSSGNHPVEIGQFAYVRKLYPDHYRRNEFKALVQFTNGPLIGETAFHALDKLEVFNPWLYEQAREGIEYLARRHAESEQWRTPFSPLVYQP